MVFNEYIFVIILSDVLVVFGIMSMIECLIKTKITCKNKLILAALSGACLFLMLKVESNRFAEVEPIHSENQYSKKVKIGIIDTSYDNDQIIEEGKNFTKYNAASKSKNDVAVSEEATGSEIIGAINNPEYVDNQNEKEFTLVSTMDDDGIVREEAVTEAYRYFEEQPVDILVVSNCDSQYIDKEQEKAVNDLASLDTIIIANQGDIDEGKSYPSQYDNVIAISDYSNEDYDEPTVKVNIYFDYGVRADAARSGYVVNVLANTFTDKYKENVRELLKEDKEMTMQEVVDYLSK